MEQAPIRLYYNGRELKDCSVIIQYQMTKCNGECKTYLETWSSSRIIDRIKQGSVIYQNVCSIVIFVDGQTFGIKMLDKHDKIVNAVIFPISSLVMINMLSEESLDNFAKEQDQVEIEMSQLDKDKVREWR